MLVHRQTAPAMACSGLPEPTPPPHDLEGFNERAWAAVLDGLSAGRRRDHRRTVRILPSTRRLVLGLWRRAAIVQAGVSGEPSPEPAPPPGRAAGARRRRELRRGLGPQVLVDPPRKCSGSSAGGHGHHRARIDPSAQAPHPPRILRGMHSASTAGAHYALERRASVARNHGSGACRGTSDRVSVRPGCACAARRLDRPDWRCRREPARLLAPASSHGTPKR